MPQSRMTTNDRGEAVYRWFADWDKHGSYIEIIDSGWVKAESYEKKTADDGALVVKLKRSLQRKPLFGRVESDDGDVSGLLVKIETFQAEEERRVDRIFASTDNEGRFTAPCLVH